MAKTREQLEKDVGAAIKLILTELEDASLEDPLLACHPNAFDERRRRVVRRVWQLYKEVLAHAASGEV